MEESPLSSIFSIKFGKSLTKLLPLGVSLDGLLYWDNTNILLIKLNEWNICQEVHSIILGQSDQRVIKRTIRMPPLDETRHVASKKWWGSPREHSQPEICVFFTEEIIRNICLLPSHLSGRWLLASCNSTLLSAYLIFVNLSLHLKVRNQRQNSQNWPKFYALSEC